MSTLLNDRADLPPAQGSKPDVLRERLLAFSEADKWKPASKEWEFVYNFRNPESNLPCMCGHGSHPSDNIVELNIIRHKTTGEEARVGSICIMEVMKGTEVYSDYKFFKPTLTQERKGIPAKVAQRAHELKIITNEELGFLLVCGRKRSMTAEQWDKINWAKAKISMRFGPPNPEEIKKLVEDRKGQPSTDPLTKESINITDKTLSWYTKRYQMYVGKKELSHMEKAYMHRILALWHFWGPYNENVEEFLAAA